jgi:hypothetical protein
MWGQCQPEDYHDILKLVKSIGFIQLDSIGA